MLGITFTRLYIPAPADVGKGLKTADNSQPLKQVSAEVNGRVTQACYPRNYHIPRKLRVKARGTHKNHRMKRNGWRIALYVYFCTATYI